MKRRTFRIVGLVLLVLAFTAYFAFSTFLFAPHEGRYAYDVSTLVPRDVDFFAAKADLGGDLDRELVPVFAGRFAETELGRTLLESPEWKELEAKANLAELRQRVREELDKLPVRIDPLKVFGGRDLALAGRVAGSGPADSRWAVYGRVNWMGKLVASLLDYPGLIGLEGQGFTVERAGARRTLSGGGLREPLSLVRVRDVLVVTNEAAFADQAITFEGNKGEDSLGQSARYHDEIQVRDRDDADELEVVLRMASVAPWLGLAPDLPKTDSRNPVEALLGRLFQTGLARELAGVVRFGDGFAADLAGQLLTENLSPLQKRFYRDSDLDTREIVDEVARWVPGDAGLFACLEMDFADLADVLLQALEPALVDNLLTGIVKPVLGHATLEAFVAELDATFKDRVMVVLAGNPYAEVEQEIPNNGDPTLVWTIGLWIEDGQKVQEILTKLTQNPGRLQLRGKPKGNGTYDAGVYQNEVSGGLRIYEFWSMLVPGTGHVATMQDARMFFVSNHYRELSRVAEAVYSRGGVESLAERRQFQGLANSALPAATFTAWIDPRKVGQDLRRILRYRSEMAVTDAIDWEVERPKIEKEVVAEHFPGERWESLSQEVLDQVRILAEPKIQSFREQFRSQNLPTLYGRIERKVRYLEAIEAALVQLQLEPKDFELALRVVAPLDE